MLGKGKAQHKAGLKILRHYTRFQAKNLLAAFNLVVKEKKHGKAKR